MTDNYKKLNIYAVYQVDDNGNFTQREIWSNFKQACNFYSSVDLIKIEKLEHELSPLILNMEILDKKDIIKYSEEYKKSCDDINRTIRLEKRNMLKNMYLKKQNNETAKKVLKQRKTTAKKNVDWSEWENLYEK